MNTDRDILSGVKNPNRRKLLLCTAACFISGTDTLLAKDTIPLQEVSNLNDFVRRDRTLLLDTRSPVGSRRKHYEFPFFKDGIYNRAIYEDLCWLSMDTHDNVAVEMDIGLFNITALTQMYLSDILGSKKPIRFTSGYRTIKTNSQTEGAARNSYHMLAKGLDFTMDGVDKYAIAYYTRYFGAGGVGIYQFHNHIDTGDERAWDNR
ncbi:MAG: DUF882 domain-containing protein [Campylobacterales bacterium]|nr:DUF882 domain-containing protein [Campylobacterales bacterium]